MAHRLRPRLSVAEAEDAARYGQSHVAGGRVGANDDLDGDHRRGLCVDRAVLALMAQSPVWGGGAAASGACGVVFRRCSARPPVMRAGFRPRSPRQLPLVAVAFRNPISDHMTIRHDRSGSGGGGGGVSVAAVVRGWRRSIVTGGCRTVWHAAPPCPPGGRSHGLWCGRLYHSAGRSAVLHAIGSTPLTVALSNAFVLAADRSGVGAGDFGVPGEWHALCRT